MKSTTSQSLRYPPLLVVVDAAAFQAYKTCVRVCICPCRLLANTRREEEKYKQNSTMAERGGKERDPRRWKGGYMWRERGERKGTEHSLRREAKDFSAG